jgi:hypothetical protein
MQEIITENGPEEDGVQNDLRVHWPQQQGAQKALHQPLLRMKNVKITPVMQILIFLSRIPDSGSKNSRSLIRIRIKEFKYCNPKNCF